jgi:hypothetical protein
MTKLTPNDLNYHFEELLLIKPFNGKETVVKVIPEKTRGNRNMLWCKNIQNINNSISYEDIIITPLMMEWCEVFVLNPAEEPEYFI